MGDLKKIDTGNGHSVYIAEDMQAQYGQLLPHLTDFYKSDFIITSPQSMGIKQLEGAQTPQERADLESNKKAFTSYMDKNGVDYSAIPDGFNKATAGLPAAQKMSAEEKLSAALEDSVATISAKNNSAAGSIPFKIDGKETPLISMNVTDVPGLYSQMSGLESSANKPQTAALDKFTVEAFMLGHEADHGAEGIKDKRVTSEHEADANAFKFLEHLKEKGLPIDDNTVQALKDARSISTLQMAPIDGLTDLEIVDRMNVVNDHATSVAVNEKVENKDLALNEAGAHATQAMRTAYASVGYAYKDEYAELLKTLPEEDRAEYANDTKKLVHDFKPNNFSIEATDNPGEDVFNDENIALGMRISQTYPDIHLAMTKAQYNEGTFDVDPKWKEGAPDTHNMKAAVGDYIEAMERQYPEYNDPGLTQQFEERIKEVKAEMAAEPEAPEPEPAPLDPDAPVYQQPKVSAPGMKMSF